MVCPHQVRHAGGGVCKGNFAVAGIPCHLACPVQQRKVEQAVDDQTVVFLCAQRTPCLKELPLLLETGAELVGGKQSRFFAGLAAGKFIGSNAGGDI